MKELTKTSRKTARVNHLYTDVNGKLLFLGKTGSTAFKDYSIKKVDQELLSYTYGAERTALSALIPDKEDKPVDVTRIDPAKKCACLTPGESSPICARCKLYATGCEHPFLPYHGSDKPIITFVLEGITKGDDNRNEIATNGDAERLKRIIREHVNETGITLKDVRWLAMTRCANGTSKLLNLKPRAKHCRYHVVEDIMLHRPQLLIPVGTTVLGNLSHKSNAQEWTGRTLTYRGWPDDWLTDPDYALERPDPRGGKNKVVGHPIFGTIPDWRVPMIPLQVPHLIYAARNEALNRRYVQSVVRALKLAKTGIKPQNYLRPWYRFTDNADEVEAGLNEIIAHPGMLVCYDTETTGLKPWETFWNRGMFGAMKCLHGNAHIVSMMFRWIDPETNEPKSIGFPWETDRWKMHKSIKRIKPLVWKALTVSRLIGHNLTFDALYSWATLNRVYTQGKLSKFNDRDLNLKRDRRMCKLADHCAYDTWHMSFAHKQERGSLGLEVIAYKWVPDLAGYEEDLTLLIDLHGDEMNPANGKGGHYLNCPKDMAASSMTSYIMGDVEVAYKAYERIKEKLEVTKRYNIPIADPHSLGNFRYYCPPDRNWIYENIMSPAARTLIKFMARGIFIDQKELAVLSQTMPRDIIKERDVLAKIDPRIISYVDEMKGKNGADWQLDLENKAQLKELLFNRLSLPILRLTKAGKKYYGSDDINEIKHRLQERFIRTMPELSDKPKLLEQAIDKTLLNHAAVDKFTLNKLTVQFEHLRPLRNYRKQFKLYSTYVRPLQNISTIIDKKARTQTAHLCFDGCVHANFLMTGTRGGRLSCQSPNLQQLPKDGLVKALFVSRFGDRGCVFNGDLSQIELRLLAALSGDKTMVDAYRKGIDLHTLTASRVFNLPYETFSKDYMKKLQDQGNDAKAKELSLRRDIAKTTNFLTGYGGGAFGLQNILAMRDIDKTIEECEHIINMFFESYPSIKKLLSYYKNFILNHQVAVSVFGRVRIFEEVLGDDQEAKSKALRAGCNHLIQSTASDMMLTALFCIEKLMREANLESILVSTVHDSLFIDCIRSELPKVFEIVTDVLNNFPEVFKLVYGDNFDTSWMIVPFSGDCECGTDYLSVRKIPGEDPNTIDWDKLLAPSVH
jgi:DNA polymerase I-like protein with 3'-5' exonuclease and polymerase domains/uracil-DNA glycosylase